MAQPRELEFGTVVRGTIETASANLVPILVYLIVMTVVGAGAELVRLDRFSGALDDAETLATLQSFSGLGIGLAGLAVFLVATLGQYFLFEAMMRNAGLGSGLGRHRYLAFVGQALLILVATMFGFALLVIPGLLMSARWSIAPALLVTSDLGVIESMRRSWNSVKGNSTPVILVLLAAVGVLLVLTFLLGGIGRSMTATDPFSVLSEQFLTNVQTVLGVAMAMFLYRRLYDESGELVEVFA